jgi:hypothetical protein
MRFRGGSTDGSQRKYIQGLPDGRCSPKNQIDLLEWTDADHLRNSKFVGLRDDKDALKVAKEWNLPRVVGQGHKVVGN